MKFLIPKRLLKGYMEINQHEELHKMNHHKTLWITTTAVLIALVVLAQLLTYAIPAGALIPTPLGPIRLSQFFTGSLVNLILIVGAGAAGFGSASIAALISPVLAALLGVIPGGIPQMIPVVMIGNLIIVAIVWLCFKISTDLVRAGGIVLKILGVIVGAAAKAVFLWAATAKLIVPLFNVKPKIAAQIGILMSWPQAVTALVGGILALMVLPALKIGAKNR